jgi:hypothetical protein
MELVTSKYKESQRSSNEIKYFWLGIFVISAVRFALAVPFAKSSTNGFRQTQTAWPVKEWIDSGVFDPFKPVVPIRGLPQDWLLEFPLFQWAAFGLAKISNISPDASVVIVALTCWIISGILISKLVLHYSNIVVALGTFGVHTFSMFGLTFGANGLIDHMATVLAISALYVVWKSGLDTENSQKLLTRSYLFLVPLSLTAAVKPNIAFMYLLPISWVIFQFKGRNLRKNILLIGFTWVLSGAVVGAWSKYSSSGIDFNDPRSIWYFHKDTFEWYFASQSQYLDLTSNLWLIFSRLSFQIGGTFFVALSLCGLVFAAKYERKLAVAGLVGATLSTGIFLNLNVVHSYYIIPAAPLVILGIGIGISGWFRHSLKFGIEQRIVAIATASIVVITILTPAIIPGDLNRYFQSTQKIKNTSKIALEVRSKVEPNELIIGFNMTHNPSILYQSGRKGFLVYSGDYPGELKFLADQDPKLFCAVVDKTGEFGPEAQQVIAGYPDAKRVSKHVWDLCP